MEPKLPRMTQFFFQPDFEIPPTFRTLVVEIKSCSSPCIAGLPPYKHTSYG